MPPKKKQQKMNGFMCFMLEMKPRLIADGKVFPRGMLDVHPVCTPLWNSLPAEKKEYYNQKAKGMPNHVKEEKYDTRGVPIAWKENEEKLKVEKKTQAHQDIENMISHLHRQKILIEQYFHFAHFNYAVATSEKEYPPCEVAIVKYSLLDGIAGTYHAYIDPGKLRIGYSYEAKVHSDATHKIPATGFNLANGNYPEILDNIKIILQQSDGKVAPIFVLDDDIPKATFILNWLLEHSCQLDADYDTINPFKVYSLNKLFYELRRHADLEDHRLRFSSHLMVAEKLCCETFDFCQNMACQWHEDEDRTKFCSLTIVRKYAYNISDFCCEYYGLTLLPNRHCPASVADESHYQVLPKVPRHSDPQPADVKSERSSGSQQQAVPRLPHVQGARLAANFQIGSSGAGRGALGAAALGVVPNPTADGNSAPAPVVGRGRGRHLLG